MKNFACIIVTIAAVILTGAQRTMYDPFPNIKGEKFLVTDLNGNGRGGIVIDSKNTIMLKLTASNGGMKMKTGPKGGVIVITDKNGKPTSKFIVVPAGK